MVLPTPIHLSNLVDRKPPLGRICIDDSLQKAVYQGQGRRDDMRPDLALLFLMPGAVLAFRALYDIPLVDWRHGVQMAVVGGIVFPVLMSMLIALHAAKPLLLLLSAIVHDRIWIWRRLIDQWPAGYC